MRSLVHLNCSFDGVAILDECKLDDWRVITTTTVDETKHTIETNDICICVVLIDENLIVKYRTQLDELMKHYPYVEWIAVLPPQLLKLSSICALIRSHFYDYHTLPTDFTRLNASLGHAYGMAKLIPRINLGVKQVASPDMIGESKEFKDIMRFVEKVAAVDASVLITGESGTGKELVAKSIHYHSERAEKPFVAINCGAIPEHLIQSELFGHEKGAFTGASQQRIGRLEAANGGTLFLDEIGDLPLRLQVNLLRCLQEGKIERVGGSKTISLDIKVIAATNVDLEMAIKEGGFRQDLYYRLNVLHIAIPPLRHRGYDALLLANFFLKKYSDKRPHLLKGFSRKSEAIIVSYSWPGNIRELVNRVKRAALLCEGAEIQPEDLGFDLVSESQRKLLTLAGAREEADKSIIARSLKYTGHNISAASKLLDISRLSLYRLINKYELETKQ